MLLRELLAGARAEREPIPGGRAVVRTLERGLSIESIHEERAERVDAGFETRTCELRASGVASWIAAPALAGFTLACLRLLLAL